MVKKESVLVVPDKLVMNKIYVIRNQKVMLDKDLAELYQVETRSRGFVIRAFFNYSISDKSIFREWKCFLEFY